ncbi:MAG: alkaline phosphatase family protein [Candidatus Omnitrophica bacterium]|nr:alkaline phosphatase family protein [Candidatus Omnitrophota bacterium]
MDGAVVLKYVDPGTGFVITGIGVWLVAFFLGFLGVFSLFFKRIFRFLKKNYKIFIVLLIILGLSLIGVVIMNQKRSNFNQRIIILGFDALSPEILEPMMEEGKLPNFLRLKREGSYKHILSTNPAQSPVAWSGFSTGKNPGKNGVFDFIVRDPKTYGLNLCFSQMEGGRPKKAIRAEAFWEYATRARVPSVIISCPVTFPPEKLYGRMLSGMGVPDILGTEGTFTFYTSEVINQDKNIGGKVFSIRRSPLMVMHLIGPRVANMAGKAENVKVPFKVSLQGKDSVLIEYQKNKLELKTGQWSDWQEVDFKLNLFKKAKGIFKFYLVEIEPEFKLYISPINFDPRDPLFPISYPKSYSKELADALGLYYTQGMPLDTWSVNEKRMQVLAFLEQVKEVLREERARLDFELKRLQRGILFSYFESPDIIQHMFWRYIDQGHPLYEKDAPLGFKETIEKSYKDMDDVLGAVLGKTGKDDTVIVLSDHGFASFRRAVHLNSWLKANGYLELKNPYTGSGQELLLDIDWSKTKAYAIGFGAIYINQLNRERDGIVSSGSETQALKEEIAQKLEKWLDEKYNQPVVHKVYKQEEIFWGDYAKETPDLYVGFNNGYRASWQTALGAVPSDLIEDNLKQWSGDHLIDPHLVPGIILSNKKIAKDSPTLYDLCPTILKMIGYDDEKLKELNFDGEPLF